MHDIGKEILQNVHLIAWDIFFNSKNGEFQPAKNHYFQL
jgi:hypothetical protein